MHYQRTNMLTLSQLGEAKADITVTVVTVALHRAHLLMLMASGLFEAPGRNPVVGQPHAPDRHLVAVLDSSRCVRLIPVRGHSG